MPQAGVEQNLIFGMFAFQMGLIDQSALVAAFHTWTSAKDRTLADILVEKGDLDDEGRVLIQALAIKHLKLHGDDPDKSLTAIHAWAQRASLAGIGDPDIEATVAQLGSGPDDHERDSENDNESNRGYLYGRHSDVGRSAVSRAASPRAGGLGAVYVALDAELNREVALKQILDRHADDPASRSRFLIEAEITGGLEHPGIVPVYGLGSYGNGRPYYAMRFIRGDSLKEAIERYHGLTAGSGGTGSSTQTGESPVTPRLEGERGRATWTCASCFAGSLTSATQSTTPILVACSIATSSRATSSWANTVKRWLSTGGWPRRPAGTTPADERTLMPSSTSGSARDASWPGHGHSRIHEPGAGMATRPARPAVGCVQPGHDAVLRAHRQAPF